MAKKAGRPTGSGIKDGKHLDAMADALTRDPSKTVNSVIMALDSKEDPENLRRRLHRKWERQGSERLAAARERHEERNSTVRRRVNRLSGGGSVLDGLTQMAHPLRNSVFFGLASGMKEPASARMLRQLNDNPAVKLANEMERIQRLTDPFYDMRKSGAFRGVLDD